MMPFEVSMSTYQPSHDHSWSYEPRSPTPKHAVVCDEVAQQAIDHEQASENSYDI